MASTSTSDATFVGRQFQKEMSDCPRWNGIEETKTQQVDDDSFHFFLPSMRQMQLVCGMNTSKMVKKDGEADHFLLLRSSCDNLLPTG